MWNRLMRHHVASDTTRQLLERSKELLADRSKKVHDFGDGWSVNRPTCFNDLHRAGILMGNCLSARDLENFDWDLWSQHPAWPRDAEGDLLELHEMSEDDLENFIEEVERGDHLDEGGSWEMSGQRAPWKNYELLHDPHGLPRAIWSEYNGEVDDLFGRHNSVPKSEYVDRINEYRPGFIDRAECPDCGGMGIHSYSSGYQCRECGKYWSKGDAEPSAWGGAGFTNRFQ